MFASHSATRFVCSLAVVLATLLALPPLHAAAADAPGAIELEFWRSSDRLGTASAYQAYLDAYPRGTFAPLARAGIEKAGLEQLAGWLKRYQAVADEDLNRDIDIAELTAGGATVAAAGSTTVVDDFDATTTPR